MVLETNKLYHKSSSRGFLRLELSKWVQIMANLQALQIFTFRFIVHLLDSSLKIKYNTLLDWYKTGENWNNVSFHSVVTKENSECSWLTCFILIGCDGVSFINPGILSNLNWRLFDITRHSQSGLFDQTEAIHNSAFHIFLTFCFKQLLDLSLKIKLKTPLVW